MNIQDDMRRASSAPAFEVPPVRTVQSPRVSLRAHVKCTLAPLLWMAMITSAAAHTRYLGSAASVTI